MRNITQYSQCVTCGLSGYTLNKTHECYPLRCITSLFKHHRQPVLSQYVTDKFSCPYKTPGKIIVQYTAIFIFLQTENGKTKYYGQNGRRYSLKYSQSENLLKEWDKYSCVQHMISAFWRVTCNIA